MLNKRMPATRSISFEVDEIVKKMAAKKGIDAPIKKAPIGFKNLFLPDGSSITASSLRL